MPKSIENTEASEAVAEATRTISDVATNNVAYAQRALSTCLRGSYETMRVLFQFQQAGLEAGRRTLEAGAEANRQVLTAWVGTTQQAERAMLELANTSSRQAERVLEASEQTSQRVADRVTREAERVAEAADATARQHERELRQEQASAERKQERAEAEHQRQQHEHEAERAREEQREQRQREQEQQEQEQQRPTINVVKREDDWAVIREDASRASGVFDTKREAVGRARELAKRDDAEVHIGRASDAEPTNGQASHRDQKPERGSKGAKS